MIPLIILSIDSPEDREYMTALYYEHERMMYCEIFKYLKNRHDTEDVLQTVLENLINNLQTLQALSVRKRSSYIKTTCRNTSINYLKKHSRIFKSEFEYQDADGVDFLINTPEDFVVRKDEYDILYAAWNTLDEKSRYFLEARYVLEKSIKEIAEDLGIQQNSARTHLSRARSKLKSKFELKAQQAPSVR